MPKDMNPRDGDSGLNCFEDDRDYHFDQYFAATGAKIKFKWSGSCVEKSINHQFPVDPNVLTRQERWRSIVPFGSDRFLQMTGIEADFSEWQALCEPAPRWLLISPLKKKWRNYKARVYQTKVETELASNPAIGVAISPVA